MPKRTLSPQPGADVLTNWPPSKDDPRLIDLVKAMAREQAREDHEAEMARINRTNTRQVA